MKLTAWTCMATIALELTACGSGSALDDAVPPPNAAPPPPVVGTLNVSLSTSGSELDPDGYSLFIDAVAEGSIATNGSASIQNVLAGIHSVGVTGLTCNCTVLGQNPQKLTITEGNTSSVEFAVSCPARELDPEVVTLEIPGEGFAITSEGPRLVVVRSEPATPPEVTADALAVSVLVFDSSTPLRTLRYPDTGGALLDDPQIAMLNDSDAVVAVTRQDVTDNTRTQVRLLRFQDIFQNPGTTLFRDVTPLEVGFSAHAVQANPASFPIVVYEDSSEPGSRMAMLSTIGPDGIMVSAATLADNPARVGISIGSADAGYLVGVTTPDAIELHPINISGHPAAATQTLAGAGLESFRFEPASVSWCGGRYAVAWWREIPDPTSAGRVLAELRATTVDTMGVPLQVPVTLSSPIDLSDGASLHRVGIGCLDDSRWALAYADPAAGLRLVLTDANLALQSQRTLTTEAELAAGSVPTVLANNGTVVVAWMEPLGRARISRSCSEAL